MHTYIQLYDEYTYIYIYIRNGSGFKSKIPYRLIQELARVKLEAHRVKIFHESCWISASQQTQMPCVNDVGLFSLCHLTTWSRSSTNKWVLGMV